MAIVLAIIEAMLAVLARRRTGLERWAGSLDKVRGSVAFGDAAPALRSRSIPAWRRSLPPASSAGEVGWRITDMLSGDLAVARAPLSAAC